MARNRQRSKQRQAERRARRLQEEGTSPVPPGLGGPAVDPEVAFGAPPEEEGRSDEVVQDEPRLEPEAPPASEEEALEQIEDWEVEDDLAEDEVEEDEAPTGEGEAGYAVRGRRGRDEHEEHRDRSRVVQFLIACWAELQRVQWPNRQAMVTLTGVVLGFVLIAGGYLGLLDAIFSELIKAIL
jgi:preprotein translocase subunit SecE